MQQSNKERSSAAGRAISIFIFAIATSLCAATAASQPLCTDPPDHVATANPRAGQGVVIDPVTGELLDEPLPARLQPTPEAPDSLATEEWPDGTVVANPGDRLRARLVAEVVDGKLVTCHAAAGAWDAGEEAQEGDRK